MPRAWMVLTALVLMAPSAFGGASSTSESVAAEAGKTETAVTENADDDKRICKRMRVTGSNIPQRVCMTQRQAREMQAQSQRLLKESQGNSARSVTTEGG